MTRSEQYNEASAGKWWPSVVNPGNFAIGPATFGAPDCGAIRQNAGLGGTRSRRCWQIELRECLSGQVWGLDRQRITSPTEPLTGSIENIADYRAVQPRYEWDEPGKVAVTSFGLQGAQMVISRIPPLPEVNVDAAKAWFQSLHDRNLLFCLDDDPATLYRIDNGQHMFSGAEVEEVNEILSRVLDRLSDKAHDLAADVLARTFLTPKEYALAVSGCG